MAKILVIDDEEGIRNLLDTLLRRKGYDVVLAESGPTGLELFAENDPMSLFWTNNEMTGLAVLRQIRSLILRSR
jgi:CheY-like chemotaxis protein